MLYNEGDQFNLVYYNGKQIESIYKDGQCIYPGKPQSVTMVKNGYPQYIQSGASSTGWYTLARANSLPSGITPVDNTYNNTISNATSMGEFISGRYPEILGYYDSSRAYNIGDTVYYSGSQVYTCYSSAPAGVSPSSSDYWVYGYAPEVIGQYLPSTPYNIGDVTVSRESGNNVIRTCISNSPESWIDGCYPEIRGKFISGIRYSPGDTVARYSEASMSYIVYTCVVSTSLFVNTNWVEGYCPKLTGLYSSTRTYKPGDIAVLERSQSMTVSTCIYPINVPEALDRSKWVYTYCPDLKELYNSTHWYNVKDIVISGSTRYTCVRPTFEITHTDWPKVYNWGASNTINWYTTATKIYAAKQLYFYINTGTSASYYPQSVTSIPIMSIIDVSRTENINNCFREFSRLSDFSPVSNWKFPNVTTATYALADCGNLSNLSYLSNWFINSPYLTNISALFYGCTQIQTVRGIEVWNIPNVTNIGLLFYNCNRLQSISDLISWGANVTHLITIGSMFYGCTNLTDISGLSTWYVPSLTDISRTFYQCSKLTNVDALSNWAPPIAEMNYTFFRCTALTNINGLHNFDTSRVTSPQYTFYECTALSNLYGIHTWDVSNITSLYYTFSYCTGLTDISALSYWNPSSLTSLYHTFANCTSLNDLTPLSTWQVASISNLSNTFESCTSLQSLDGLSTWNVSNATDLYYTFNKCSSLTDISALSTWNISNATRLYYTFGECSSLSDLSPIGVWDTQHLRTLYYTFYDCSSITTLDDISTWNTYSLTALTGAFSGCTSLTDISTISVWDISHVTSLYYTFSRCVSLTDISPLTVFNNSRLNDIAGTFNSCTLLTDLTPITNWPSSQFTSMRSTFGYCANLSDLSPIQNWNTSNVWDMDGLFSHCISLTTLECISGWDVSKVSNSVSMFFGSGITPSGLAYISNWDFHPNAMNTMFKECLSLTYIPNLYWNIGVSTSLTGANLTSMFEGCSNLTDISGLRQIHFTDSLPRVEISSLFYGCSQLSDLTPIEDWFSNITVSGTYAFQNTAVTNLDALYKWKLASGAYYIFANMNKLEKADFSKFINCSGIGLVTTFYGCSALTIVDLGSIVSSIIFDTYYSSGWYNRGVFQNCNNLSTMIIRNSTMVQLGTTNTDRPYYYYNFYNTKLRTSEGKIYVPQALLSEYTNDSKWRSAVITSGCQFLPLEGSPYEQPGSI